MTGHELATIRRSLPAAAFVGGKAHPSLRDHLPVKQASVSTLVFDDIIDAELLDCETTAPCQADRYAQDVVDGEAIDADLHWLDGAGTDSLEAEVIDPDVVVAELFDDPFAVLRNARRQGRQHCTITRHARLLGVAGALGFMLATGCSRSDSTEMPPGAAAVETPAPSPDGTAVPRHTGKGVASAPKSSDPTEVAHADTLMPLGDIESSTTTAQSFSEVSDQTAAANASTFGNPAYPSSPITGPESITTYDSSHDGPASDPDRGSEPSGEPGSETFVNLSAAQSAVQEYEILRPYLTELLPEFEGHAWLLAALIGERFPEGERGPALAVAWCESRWGADERAFDTSWPDAGWLQINRFWHEERAAAAGYTWDQVRLELPVNVDMAVDIWEEAGWGAWTCSKVLPEDRW